MSTNELMFPSDEKQCLYLLHLKEILQRADSPRFILFIGGVNLNQKGGSVYIDISIHPDGLK
jgi:hypothetical protein